MRRKRIVSSIAALTMAASAFAGMAVTASAETITENYESSEVSVGFEKIAGRGSGTVSEGTGSNTSQTYKLSAASNEQNAVPGLHLMSKVSSGWITSISFDCTVSNYSSVVLGNAASYETAVEGSQATGNTVSASVEDGVAFTFGTTRQRVGGNNSNCFDINNGQTLNEVTFTAGNWYHVEVSLDNDNKTATYTISNYGEEDSIKNGTVGFMDTDIPYVDSIILRSGNNNATINIDNINITTEVVSHTVTVNNNLTPTVGGVINTQEKFEVIEGASYTYPYPRYIVNDGTIYGYTSGSTSIDSVIEDTTMELVYNEIEDAVYFSEAEALCTNSELIAEDVAYSAGKYAPMVAANSMAGAYGIGTFSAGEYKVTAHIVSRTDRGLKLRDANGTLQYGVDADVVADIANSNTTAGSTVSVDFVLEEETTLKLTGITTSNNRLNQSADFDYILIERTGDLPVDPEPETDYVAANVSRSADESGLFIGDEGEEFPSAAVITGTVDATDLAENGKYTWVVNVKGSDNADNLFAKEFTATTTISGNSSVVFGLVVYNFEDVGLTDVNADDVQARLYLKGLDEITQPIE